MEAVIERSDLVLTKEEMQALGYLVIDHLVDHFLTLGGKPVSRIGEPTDLRDRFAEPIPDLPTAPDVVFRRVVDEVFGYMMHTTHPRFLAYVPSPSNYVSVMADALVAGYNPFAGTWMEASGPAEIERVTIRWLCQLFGFPETSGGLFTSGGSLANLTGLAVARLTRLEDGFQDAVVYASDQTHASVGRALRVLGFSAAQYRILPSDQNYRLDIPAFALALDEDRAAGRRPFCLIANAGTTNTGAVDPLPALAEICQREELWLHVDAAYGGAAILTDQGKEQLAGLNRVDSLVVDPHKWLFQPYEIGCILLREQTGLREAFHYLPEYLLDLQGEGEEINYSEYGIQLTRSFRALKFWMSLQVFGLDAFRAAVNNGLALAEWAERSIRQSESLEVVTPAQLGVITFRYQPAGLPEEVVNRLNQRLVDAVIHRGEAMISSTRLQGKVVLRMCLINPRTTTQDVEFILALVEKLARNLDRGRVKSPLDNPNQPGGSPA